MVQLQKYPNTFHLVFFLSLQIIQNVVALTHYFQHMQHVEITFKYINIYAYVFHFVCIKGKLVLLLDKAGYVSQEMRSNFIDSQNFYFHYKLFCIKAVHLFDKLLLTCPRVWHIEDICIGLYILKTSFERAAHLIKSCVNATQF